MGADISTYRLTVVAAFVVVVLSAGIVTVFGGIEHSAAYLQLVGAVAIPGLFGLFRLERTAKVVKEHHVENVRRLNENSDKLDELRRELRMSTEAVQKTVEEIEGHSK